MLLMPAGAKSTVISLPLDFYNVCFFLLSGVTATQQRLSTYNCNLGEGVHVILQVCPGMLIKTIVTADVAESLVCVDECEFNESSRSSSADSKPVGGHIKTSKEQSSYFDGSLDVTTPDTLYKTSFTAAFRYPYYVRWLQSLSFEQTCVLPHTSIVATKESFIELELSGWGACRQIARSTNQNCRYMHLMDKLQAYQLLMYQVTTVSELSFFKKNKYHRPDKNSKVVNSEFDKTEYTGYSVLLNSVLTTVISTIKLNVLTGCPACSCGKVNVTGSAGWLECNTITSALTSLVSYTQKMSKNSLLKLNRVQYLKLIHLNVDNTSIYMSNELLD